MCTTKVFEDKSKLSKEFAKWILDRVVSLNLERSRESAGSSTVKGREYHIALSGGSTPKLMFEELSKVKTADNFWKNVHFWWGDERCVEPTDSDSNYRMTKESLFDNIDIPTENIHRVEGERDPEEESNRYSSEMLNSIPSISEVPLFDLIILGMGDDGHTASIFPHELELFNSEKLTVVATHPTSGQKRVSITGKVINSAKEVAFLVAGSDKSEKYKMVVDGGEAALALPSFYVAPESGKLTWFLDKAVL